MAYSNQDRAMALQLWLAGKEYTDISEQTGINKNTLIKWADKDSWELRKQEHLEVLLKLSTENIAVYRIKTAEVLEQLRDEMIVDYKMAKSPTKDKIVEGIVKITDTINSLRGIPNGQETIKVEHTGKIGHLHAKLEDLIK